MGNATSRRRLQHICLCIPRAWGYQASLAKGENLFPLNKSQLSDATRGRADHIY